MVLLIVRLDHAYFIFFSFTFSSYFPIMNVVLLCDKFLLFFFVISISDSAVISASDSFVCSYCFYSFAITVCHE